MRVEVFVQNFRGLFAEVSSLTPATEEFPSRFDVQSPRQVSTLISEPCTLCYAPLPDFPILFNFKERTIITHLASRNRLLRIMTASQVDCLSCIWMLENFLWMIWTILSISFGVIGLVRLCSLRRFITWVVNSLHAWNQIEIWLVAISIRAIVNAG